MNTFLRAFKMYNHCLCVNWEFTHGFDIASAVPQKLCSLTPYNAVYIVVILGFGSELVSVGLQSFSHASSPHRHIRVNFVALIEFA